MEFFSGENFFGEIFFEPRPPKGRGRGEGGEVGDKGDRGEGGDGGDWGGELDQGEVSTIILGMLDSSGFRKYSTLLVIQLFSRRLCLCHCLCIRLCLCICVPYSFLNSYYHKLSENVWVGGSGASRSGGKKKKS